MRPAYAQQPSLEATAVRRLRPVRRNRGVGGLAGKHGLDLTNSPLWGILPSPLKNTGKTNFRLPRIHGNPGAGGTP